MSERVLLIFTLSENERLEEDVKKSGLIKADFIRRALHQGMKNFEALVAACEEEADEAIHQSVGWTLQDLSAEDIGAKRHQEEGEQAAARPGRRRRFGLVENEERGHRTYTIRLTPRELRQAQEKAESIGLTVGGFIWRLLMGYPLFSLRMATYEAWADVEDSAYAVKAISITHRSKFA